MKRLSLLACAFTLLIAACTKAVAPAPGQAPTQAAPTMPAVNYFDNTGRTDVLGGGARMIPITTPKGKFNVWTKRVGNNPRIKVLLLHGGPGGTHEAFEVFDSYFPGAGIEYYYYDQLGSFYSDQPDMAPLLDVARFVDEVEQVRQALGLNNDNFYLYGQSWGGLLAIEYALAHQENLKGLIVSNMMSSIPKYNEYAEKVLMPAMDQKALAEIKELEKAGKYEDPRYMQLLVPNYYAQHLLRLPPGPLPEPLDRAIKHINPKVYIPMQGPSEMGASGKLVKWDRSADLKSIAVPTLVIAGQYDTMDPKDLEWMSHQFPKGRYLLCPTSGHLAEYDDPQTYFTGLIAFLKDVDAGKI